MRSHDSIEWDRVISLSERVHGCNRRKVSSRNWILDHASAAAFISSTLLLPFLSSIFHSVTSPSEEDIPYLRHSSDCAQLRDKLSTGATSIGTVDIIDLT